MGFFAANNDAEICARLERIEGQLDAIMRHLGIPAAGGAGDFPAEAAAAAAEGDKIGAIKLYRKATGKGLKEAKDAVEAYCAARGT